MVDRLADRVIALILQYFDVFFLLISSFIIVFCRELTEPAVKIRGFPTSWIEDDVNNLVKSLLPTAQSEKSMSIHRILIERDPNSETACAVVMVDSPKTVANIIKHISIRKDHLSAERVLMHDTGM